MNVYQVAESGECHWFVANTMIEALNTYKEYLENSDDEVDELEIRKLTEDQARNVDIETDDGEGEKTAWEWAQEGKPRFIGSSVF